MNKSLISTYKGGTAYIHKEQVSVLVEILLLLL